MGWFGKILSTKPPISEEPPARHVPLYSNGHQFLELKIYPPAKVGEHARYALVIVHDGSTQPFLTRDEIVEISKRLQEAL